MVHYLNLHDDPFKLIKSGFKNVEMRLNDERRKCIAVGDVLVFTNVLTNEKITCKVTKLNLFKNFEELYQNYSKEEIGYLENEIANPDDMLQYYSKEKIEKYGTLAIHIELIKNFYVIVFDMDDTLLRDDKKISNYTIKILTDLKNIGHKIVINTARSKFYNQEYFDLIKPSFAILNGGSLIIDENENIIYENKLKVNVQNLVNDLLKYTKRFSFQTLDKLFTNNQNYKNQGAIYLDFQSNRFDEPTYKVVASFKKREDAEAIASKHNIKYVSYLDGTFGRFSNIEDNKSSGNKFLSNFVNISLSNFIVFGDDYGDLEMINAAKHGYLMKNANEDVKQKATKYTQFTNNDDGVAKELLFFFKNAAEPQYFLD